MKFESEYDMKTILGLLVIISCFGAFAYMYNRGQFVANSVECWDYGKLLFKAQGRIKVHYMVSDKAIFSTEGQKFHISGKCVASEVVQ